MGFFDSMKKAYDEDVKNMEDRRKCSSYKTVESRDRADLERLHNLSDSELLNLYRKAGAWEEEKIESVLEARCFFWDESSGSFDKR